MSELSKFRVFLALAKTKSFSRAAEVLGISQPVVSIYVKQLEEEYRVKLVDRLGRKNVLTKDGELFLKYVREILRLEEKLREEFSAKRGVLKGKLRVGGSNIPGTYVLPRIVGGFLGQHKGVRLSVFIGDSMEVQRKVVEGELEFGVVGAVFDGKRLDSRPLLKDELVLIAPREFEKERISPEDLSRLPYVQRESGSGTRKTVEAYLKERTGSQNLNVVLYLSSNEAIKRAVMAGAGLSFVSSLSVEDELSQGILKRVKVDGFDVTREFYLVKRKGKTLSPVGEALFNYFLERCEGERV